MNEYRNLPGERLGSYTCVVVITARRA